MVLDPMSRQQACTRGSGTPPPSSYRVDLSSDLNGRITVLSPNLECDRKQKQRVIQMEKTGEKNE